MSESPFPHVMTTDQVTTVLPTIPVMGPLALITVLAARTRVFADLQGVRRAPGPQGLSNLKVIRTRGGVSGCRLHEVSLFVV